MKVSILADNIANEKGFLGEAGLSLFIRHNGFNILFDTGESGVFLHNAKVMGVDVKSADAIVLSHGHYDHCGGLVHFPQTEPLPPVYVHRSAFVRRYHEDDGVREDIGIPWSPEEHPAIQKSLVLHSGAMEPLPGVHLIAEIPQTTGFEPIPKRFLAEGPNGVVPDTFPDEQALVIETEDGLAVFLGCSHPGVVSCIAAIQRRFPGKRICALVAGMHLYSAGPDRIEKTVDWLAESGIPKIVPLHCTGIVAICEMKRRLGDRCVLAATGEVLEI